MDLKEKIKKLPCCPGVYLMKDSLDTVIYVGKSKNLKSRVGSYFQDSKSHSPKVVKMVKNIKDFEHITTDTEFEAFLLENRLIKEIKPFYNKLLKSTKSYSYIKISINEKYPAIEISGESDESDGNIYFGPYTNKNTVERGLQGIKECCRISCTSGFQKTSPCLNYSLGLCIGMCLDNSSAEQYIEIINKIIKTLNGTDKSIIEEIEYKMNCAARKLDFESAAKYRDYLSAINSLIRKVKVVEYTKQNKNIVLLEHLSDGDIKYFLIRGVKIISSEKYPMEGFGSEKLKTILKSDILTYFDSKAQISSIEINRDEIDEAQIIYSYINNKSNNCSHVVIKEKWLNASNSIKLDNAINKLLPAERVYR